MFERIKALMERWHEIKEISALTDRDLDDLGMTRDQLTRFAHMPKDVANRVTHMAEIFGLSEDDIRRDHAAYVDLLETCGSCADRGACSLVLAKGELASPADCGFCLNRHAFAATPHLPSRSAA